MESKFKKGDFLIPNGILELSFTYARKSQLIEGVEYEVATKRQLEDYIRLYRKEELDTYTDESSFNKKYKESVTDSRKERDSEIEGYRKTIDAIKIFK